MEKWSAMAKKENEKKKKKTKTKIVVSSSSDHHHQQQQQQSLWAGVMSIVSRWRGPAAAEDVKPNCDMADDGQGQGQGQGEGQGPVKSESRHCAAANGLPQMSSDVSKAAAWQWLHGRRRCHSSPSPVVVTSTAHHHHHHLPPPPRNGMLNDKITTNDDDIIRPPPSSVKAVGSGAARDSRFKCEAAFDRSISKMPPPPPPLNLNLNLKLHPLPSLFDELDLCSVKARMVEAAHLPRPCPPPSRHHTATATATTPYATSTDAFQKLLRQFAAPFKSGPRPGTAGSDSNPRSAAPGRREFAQHRHGDGSDGDGHGHAEMEEKEMMPQQQHYHHHIYHHHHHYHHGRPAPGDGFAGSDLNDEQDPAEAMELDYEDYGRSRRSSGRASSRSSSRPNNGRPRRHSSSDYVEMCRRRPDLAFHGATCVDRYSSGDLAAQRSNLPPESEPCVSSELAGAAMDAQRGRELDDDDDDDDERRSSRQGRRRRRHSHTTEYRDDRTRSLSWRKLVDQKMMMMMMMMEQEQEQEQETSQSGPSSSSSSSSSSFRRYNVGGGGDGVQNVGNAGDGEEEEEEGMARRRGEGRQNRRHSADGLPRQSAVRT